MQKQLCLLVLSLCANNLALAHHASDAGASPLASPVLTADLLEPGAIQMTVGIQSSFNRPTGDEQLEAELRSHPGHDETLLSDGTLSQSLDLGFGLTPWLQANLSGGSARVENLREGHLHGNGSYGFHAYGSPSGQRDTELRLKARLAGSESWSLAVLTGLSLPMGRDDVLGGSIAVAATANTTTGKVKASGSLPLLARSSQLGGGSATYMLGAAYSRHLAESWHLDSSVAASLRPAYQGFKAGNQIGAGLALAWVFDPEAHGRGRVTLDAMFSHVERSDFRGLLDENSGGWTLSAGPRFSVGLNERMVFTLGASAPLARGLNGHQYHAPEAAAQTSLSALF